MCAIADVLTQQVAMQSELHLPSCLWKRPSFCASTAVGLSIVFHVRSGI